MIDPTRFLMYGHDLTRKQASVLAYIRKFIFENGFPPTEEEVKEGLGFDCVSRGKWAIKMLIRKGYISRTKSRRSITLLK